jgi:hypothetical protein
MAPAALGEGPELMDVAAQDQGHHSLPEE